MTRQISWIALHAVPDLPDQPTLYLQHRRLGYWDCRFHWIVRRCGTLRAGRPDHLPGVHLPGYDAASIAIAVPEMTGRGWSNPLVFSLADLLQQLLHQHPEATLCLSNQVDIRTEFPHGHELLERLRSSGLVLQT